jgi:hypothetical protein
LAKGSRGKDLLRHVQLSGKRRRIGLAVVSFGCGPHNGSRFDGALDLFEKLRSEKYKGEWFIPPRQLLQALRCRKDIGALNGTFPSQRDVTCRGVPQWYWSCSKVGGYVAALSFLATAEKLCRESTFANCRPCRMERVPGSSSPAGQERNEAEKAKPLSLLKGLGRACRTARGFLPGGASRSAKDASRCSPIRLAFR